MCLSIPNTSVKEAMLHCDESKVIMNTQCQTHISPAKYNLEFASTSQRAKIYKQWLPQSIKYQFAKETKQTENTHYDYKNIFLENLWINMGYYGLLWITAGYL